MELQRMIARFVAEPAPLRKALYLARRSILDTMGAMIAGSETAAVRQALTVTEDGCCTVPGRGEKLCGRDAAFLSTESPAMSWSWMTRPPPIWDTPTVAVFAGTAGDRRRDRLFRAAAAGGLPHCHGGDVQAGRICAKRLHAKGWHCSSVTAGIGAAAGCAYLLGLSQEQTSHALGIAASMASGLRENFGTQTKSIHIGKCAEDGYRAARLAQAGFTSSTVALEGKEGFLYEYADLREEGDEFHRIMASMGHDWDICAPGFTLKRWPSCSSTHRPVDAIMELIQINQLSAAEIEYPGWTGHLRSAGVGDAGPGGRREAKFSVGFQIGLYLTDRANAPENYNRETIRLPEVQNIIRRTELYHEPRYDDLPSDAGVGPAFVTICCKDGRTFTKERAFPVGHLSDPIPDEELRKKFFTCTAEKLTLEQAEALSDAIMTMEKIENIRSLMDMTHSIIPTKGYPDGISLLLAGGGGAWYTRIKRSRP